MIDLHPSSRMGKAALSLVALPLVFSAAKAHASGILSGGLADAANYSILYTGNNGNTLNVDRATINGNIGIGDTGGLNFNGPGGVINGSVSFAAANTGQLSNTGVGNVGPASVNYGVSSINTDITNLSTFQDGLRTEPGTAIAISGNQVINASSGTLDTINGQQDEVFDVTSYSEPGGDAVTINGNGDNVIFIFADSLGSIDLDMSVNLTGGLAPNDLLWAFLGTDTNTITVGDPPADPFEGIVMAMHQQIVLDDANLVGNVFGGDSSNLIVDAHSEINPTPEPSSLLLLGTGLLGLGGAVRRKLSA